MKRNFLIILCFLFVATLYSQSNAGIEFYSEPFEKAVKLSKELKRPIFIDFSTSWCGPCKQMENFVFTDSIVGNFYNKNFICLKYDAEKGEGIVLKNKFEIKAYPTLLYLSPELEIELKHIGFKDPKEFIELGNSVINEKSLYKTIQSSLSNKDSNKITPIKLDSYLNGISQFEKDSILIDYFQNIPQNKWNTPQYFSLIENHSYSIFSPLTQYVVINREKYSELYGKERIDIFISRLMSFAYGTPTNLYGKSYNKLPDNEINKLLYNELAKIDSAFARKNKLNNEIVLLCMDLRDNFKSNEIWDSLLTKAIYYNEYYSHFDKEWYNIPNNWYYRALNIIPKNLEKKKFTETSLKKVKSRLTENDYNEFAESLCIGTVQEFVSCQKQSKNSKKELSVALETLAESYPVSKTWANQILSRINVSDKDIINYKEELIKNAL